MMLHQPVWIRNLAAYSLQVVSIVIAGSLLLSALRIHLPTIRLAYWQALLAACVLLPLIQPWKSGWAPAERLGAISQIRIAGQPSASATWSFAGLVLAVLLGGIILRLFRVALGFGKLWIYRRRARLIRQESKPILEAQALTGVRP
jgi:hypothetical protein